MKYGVIHYNAPGGTNLVEFLDWVAESGFDCTELQCPDVWPKGEEQPEKRAEEVLKLLQERNLECSAVSLHNDFVVLAAEDVEFQVARSKRMAQVIQVMGCNILRTEGGAPKESVSRDRYVEAMAGCLKRCAEWAEPMGVKLAVDNHGIVSNNMQVMLDTLRAVNSPAIGTNLDTMNVRWFGNSLPEIDKYYEEIAPFVMHTHMKDGFGWREGYRGAALGEGEINLKKAVDECKKAGYNGPWVAEYEGPEGDGVGYRKCLAWMKANID
jgi:sugar phosphate isomerase/epimerase